MSICPRCGEDNAERARFCSTCGEALAPAAARAEVRKTVTVVFCDVANSTRLGERLDPEAHRRVMGRYFETMRTVLERHGGTVEKFIGDAVMAVFGIPVLHEDDSLRAVRAAAEMREALSELNRELRSTWDLEIAIRTGVNTGEVVTGDPGTAQTLVTGDAVVVAKRLEETAVANEIQVGVDTYRLVQDAVLAEPIGLVEAKGKPAMSAWRLLAVRPDAEVTSVRLDSPLVGRELELAALQEIFERIASERSCRLFTVLGPAGIGKSRLVHELISTLGDRALVLRGRCLPYGEGISFWPLVEVVKQAARLTERDSPKEARRKIGALLPQDQDAPLICQRVAAAVGRGEAESARPEETFWAVRRLFEALGRDQPLVLVFDDIQWAETTFLDLVEYIAGWSTGAPLLLCCLARPDLLEIRPSWGLPRPNATAILLDPLAEPETEQLIANLLGRLPFPGEVRSRIATAADGNPLFVEEMLRMLRDEGLLRREDGGWSAAADLDDVAVPPTIHALLSARLDHLEPGERAVIQRASVAGQVFWWGAVAELSPGPARDSLGTHLQALVRKELIRHDRSAFAAEDAFRFGHILVRDAAYGSLPKEARADLHERLAAWLERKVGPTAEHEEILGYHLEQAYRYRCEIGRRDERAATLAKRAGRRLAAAGRRALGRGDAPAASNLLDRAVTLLGEDELAEALLALGRARWDLGDLAAAERVFDEAADAAVTAGDDRTASLSRIEAVFVRGFRDPETGAEELLRTATAAIEAFEESADGPALAKAWSRLADAYWIRGRCAEMEDCLERALGYVEEPDALRDLPNILSALGTVAVYGPRPLQEALQRCEELLARARGNAVLEADLMAKLALLEAMQGRFRRARDLLADVERTLGELGSRLALAGLRGYTGAVELLAGEPGAAVRELSRGIEEFETMGERGVLSTLAGDLAEALHEEGRYEAAERATVLSEEAAAADDAISQILWRGVRAKLLARRGKYELAERLAREAVAFGETTDALEHQARARASLAEVLLLAGRLTEAEGELDEVVALHDVKGSVVLAARARALREQLAAVPPA